MASNLLSERPAVDDPDVGTRKLRVYIAKPAAASPNSTLTTMQVVASASSSLGKMLDVAQAAPSSDLDIMNSLEDDIRLRLSGDVLLSSDACADLSLRTQGDGRIHFNLRHPDFPLRLFDLYYSIPASDMDKICSVLQSAARFMRYLRIDSASEEPARCDVEVHRLILDNTVWDRDFPEWDKNFWKVCIRTGDNLVRDGAAQVIADHETLYGLTVKNTTHQALYISAILFFDCSDFSICKWPCTPLARIYLKGHTAKSCPKSYPLPDSGVAAVGYGVDKWPLQFYLRPEQSKDIGFLKLLLTKTPVDFSCIEQTEQFRTSRAEGLGEDRVRELLQGTVTLPVIQSKQ